MSSDRSKRLLTLAASLTEGVWLWACTDRQTGAVLECDHFHLDLYLEKAVCSSIMCHVSWCRATARVDT